MTTSPAATRNRDESLPRPVPSRDRKRSEHRHALDELELRSGGDGPVDLDEPAVGEQREQRQDRADDDERRPRPDRSDDRRRGDRADRDAAHRETPDEPEHAGQDRRFGTMPLEEREHRDVLDAVGRADDREQEDRGDEIGSHGAISVIGTPQKTSDSPKGTASRPPRASSRRSRRSARRRRSRRSGNRPRAAPPSKTWKAATTIRTFRQPRTNVCATIRATTSRALGPSCTTARNPAAIMRRRPRRRRRRRGRRGPRP